jgi:uncharacterized membrane protein YhaH (DUF805 family)
MKSLKNIFEKYYLKVIRDNYSNFSGRANRKEFWMFVLTLYFGSFLFFLMFIPLMMITEYFIILFQIYLATMIIPSIAITVRRLHDHGESGKFLFVFFIPLIGGILLLIFLYKKGHSYENKYGVRPS